MRAFRFLRPLECFLCGEYTSPSTIPSNRLMVQSARKVEVFESLAESPSRNPSEPPSRKAAPWIRIGTVVVGAVLLIGAVLLTKYWPFSRVKIVQDLEQGCRRRHKSIYAN
jgi:hypothetical protein